MRSQRGYVLLTLLLMVALMTIAAGILTESLATEIRRDREEELIHRAMEYRRAVRRFTKQTGRFPMKIEDLENTNGIRYLRKRYKDPITGKEFRVLHMTELAQIGVGASVGTPAAALNGNGAADLTDTSGQAQDQTQDSSPAVPPPANPAQSTAGQGTFGFGSSGPGSSPNAGAQAGATASSSTQGNNSFGGGVIIGVVSTSTKKTIREFNNKSHYNQWYFFYDPTFDRGYEVKGPTPLTQTPPNLQGPAQGSPNSPAVPGQSSAGQTPSAPPQQ